MRSVHTIHIRIRSFALAFLKLTTFSFSRSTFGGGEKCCFALYRRRFSGFTIF